MLTEIAAQWWRADVMLSTLPLLRVTFRGHLVASGRLPPRFPCGPIVKVDAPRLICRLHPLVLLLAVASKGVVGIDIISGCSCTSARHAQAGWVHECHPAACTS